MKRRIVYVGLFLFNLGLGIGLATYFRSIHQVVEPNIVMALPPTEAIIVPFPETKSTPATSESLLDSLTASVENPLTDPEEIKKVLRELSLKNRAYLTSQDGWLNTRIYEYLLPGDNPANLTAIPPAQTYSFLYTADGIRVTDDWYRTEKGTL